MGPDVENVVTEAGFMAQRPPLSAGLEDNRLRYCSFCGGGEHEREYLIAADAVYICERCVDVCRDVIGAAREGKRAAEQHAVSSNASLTGAEPAGVASELKR